MENELKRGKRRINLTDVKSTVETARDRAEELLTATRSLPDVDEEGNSDCPFAEERYAKKEKIQQEVEGLFKRLHESKADVEYLIDNCKRNLEVVSANEDMLNSDRPRAKFSEAEAALAVKYKAYVRLRERIEETIKIVDKALREAVGKRYPGRSPKNGREQGSRRSQPTKTSSRRLGSLSRTRNLTTCSSWTARAELRVPRTRTMPPNDCEQVMNSQRCPLDLLLGRGGQQPGIDRLPPNETDVTRLLGLPPGLSVYAVDADATGTTVVAGSRAGTIHVLHGENSVCLEQGALVLAVCLLDGSRLASTDTLGRCFLWEPLLDPQHPRSMLTEGSRICSLLGWPDGRLLGLSAEGRLLWWDTHTGEMVQSIDCPAPPEKLALVRLLRWPDQNIIVYPATGGQVTLCILEKRKVRTWDAHEGDCYAAFFAGASLCTIGRADGLMRVWNARGTQLGQYLAPKGAIAAEATLDDRGVLVVTDDGHAGVYERESGALHLKGTLAGADYRAVRGPTSDVRKRIFEEQRWAIGRKLCQHIQEKLNAGETEGLDSLHQKLVDIGYKAISLALQAQQAVRERNAIAELRARHLLGQILPPNQPNATTSLLHHAESLERAWLLHEALTVLGKVKAAGDAAAPSEWLERTAKAMKGERWVVDPDLPVPDLVEASTVVGKPFSGHWVLSRFEPIPFPERRLSAMELVKKYEQVRQEDGRAGLPCARLQDTPWLSRSTPVTAETVFFAGSPNEMTEGAELAIQVLHDGLQTILAPYLLLAASDKKAAGSPSEHNQWVAGTLHRIMQGDSIGPWLDAVRRTLTYAVRRLRTETMGLRPSA